MATGEALNMYDFLPAIGPIAADFGLQYRVLGGAATRAMAGAEHMSLSDNTIWPANDLHLGTVRPENGSPRDIDVLLMTTDTSKIDDVYSAVRAEIGHAVKKISVFGIADHEAHMSRSPIKANLTDFTSERTVSRDGKMYYVCHPYADEINPASHERWTVHLNGGQFDTLSPFAQIRAYESRSASGIRGRDVPKAEAIQKAIDATAWDQDAYILEYLDGWTDFIEKLNASGRSDGTLPGFIAANRSKLISFLNEQDWAIEAAQGSGPLGKLFAPIQARLIREGSETEKGERQISPLEARYIELAQKISAATGGIITPGNVLSTISLLMTFHGANHLDDLSGIAELAVGEGVDIVDGKAARHSKTASKLGAAVDAGFDKVKMAYLLYKGVRSGAIPLLIGAEIAAQNLANAGLTLYGEIQKLDMTASIEGKHTRFIQISTMATSMLANALAARPDEASQKAAKALKVISYGGFAYQLKTGYDATKGYYKVAVLKMIQDEEQAAHEDPAERLFPYAASKL